MDANRITKDSNGVEWIHRERPRYYLHKVRVHNPPQEDDGKWVVIDRRLDLAATKHYARKSDVVRAFLRELAIDIERDTALFT